MASNSSEQIVGSNNVEDHISALGGADEVYGFGSDDFIQGGTGDDRLFGGTGNDQIFGDEDNDTIFYESGDDTITGGSGYDIFDIRSATTSSDPNELTHIVEFGPAFGISLNLLNGAAFGLSDSTTTPVGVGEDSVALANGLPQNLLGNLTFATMEEFRLTKFSDFIAGNSADLTINMRSGDDLMQAGSGREHIIGGGGFDWVSYEESNAAVSVALSDGSASGGFAIGDHLEEIEALAGSRFDDSLQGDNGDNTLAGLQGKDFLKGGGGTDTLLGGENDDVLMGNVGSDSLDGGAGADTASYAFNSHSVVVSLGSNGADGTAKELTTDTNPAVNPSTTVTASVDTLRSIENVVGSDQDDVLFGNAEHNEFFGRDGNDLLRGGAGDDTLDGGDGIDTVDYLTNPADQGVTVNLTTGIANEFGPFIFQGQEFGSHVVATDTLISIENARGSNGTDTLTGTGGVNVLEGRGDSDRLAGLAGADTLNGGSGTDTADYSASAVGVTVDLVTGRGTFGDAQGDTLISIENLVGSALDDILSGDNGANRIEGGKGADRLIGGGNNDVLIGGEGSDQLFGGTGTNTMTGGANDDFYFVESATDVIVEGAGQGTGDRVFASVSYTLGAGVQVEKLTTANNSGTEAINLTGNEFANVLYGNAGGNTLDGRGDADTMVGLTGDDIYFVDNAADQVLEGANAGSDRVLASVSYTLGAGQEIEKLSTADIAATTAINLTGNEIGNTVFGNAGTNTLDGKGGADTLLGLGGDDFYFVDNAADSIFEALGQGADRVFTSASYTLGAGQQIEKLTTDNNAGTAAINLTGNEFANDIFGNAGANVINGGLGNDTLFGLGGADIFTFNTALGANNVDTIGDFGPINDDLIALDDAIFTAAGPVGQLAAAAFFTGTAAHDADDRIIYNANTGAVFYDADGTGSIAAVQFATVAGHPAMFESDFIVI